MSGYSAMASVAPLTRSMEVWAPVTPSMIMISPSPPISSHRALVVW